MSNQNTTYQLLEGAAVKAEGPVRDCWAEMLKLYKNNTIHYLVQQSIRIEPKK